MPVTALFGGGSCMILRISDHGRDSPSASASPLTRNTPTETWLIAGWAIGSICQALTVAVLLWSASDHLVEQRTVDVRQRRWLMHDCFSSDGAVRTLGVLGCAPVC